MLTYKGGNAVGKGTYWEVTSGRRVDVFSDTVLAGTGSATYVKMPAGVMLVSGPIIGLLYVILLPFIGIAAIATLAGRMVFSGLHNLAAKSSSFGWRPMTAYLSGKKNKKKDKK